MAEGRIDELRRRIDRDPGSRLFAQLAEELRKEGAVEEAISVARAGLGKHPAYPSARLTLGRALLDSGDPAAARTELEAAVTGAPDNILANRLLGEALETLGDLGAALLQYRATLQLAPGDGHIEARVRVIEERLGGPGEAPRKPAPAGGLGAGPGTSEPKEEGRELPPTIRIRMPGDRAAPAPGALPSPAAPAGKATGGSVFAEDGPRGQTAPSQGAEAGDKPAGGETTVRRPVVAAKEHAPNLAPKEQLAPSEEPAGAAGGGDGGPAQGAETPPLAAEETRPVEPPEEARAETAARDSDLAPTLPGSRAAEYAAVDEPEDLPPTLPPGVITGVGEAPLEEPRRRDPIQGEPGRAEAREDGPGEVPRVPAGGAVAAESEGRGDVETTGDLRNSPSAPPAGEREREGLGSVEEGVAGRQRPLSSGTLAELYFQQGLLERAVEVYRQVLEEEPGNARARARLGEIEVLVTASAADLPGDPEGSPVDTATRRRALERAIERLEALLAAVRKR